jgi:hypothetical protein
MKTSTSSNHQISTLSKMPTTVKYGTLHQQNPLSDGSNSGFTIGTHHLREEKMTTSKHM